MTRGMVLVAAAVVATAGCTSAVRSPLEQEITKRVTPDKPEFDINGWTDRAGAHHKLLGRARVVGDSIQFYELPYVDYGNPPPAKLVATVPRSDVAEVSVQRFDPSKTVMCIAAPALVYGLIVLIIVESGYEP